MVTDEKGQSKNMYMKRNQKSNHCAKNVLQCRILKASKTDVNGAKVQTTEKYIQFDAWARTATGRCNAKMQKQANLCISAINFILCFSQKFKSKNIVFKLKNVIMR